MNKVRVVLAVCLAILAVWSWSSYGKKMNGREADFERHVQNAEAYVEQRLYQKAVKEYESAFWTKEDEGHREAWLEAIRNGVEDGVFDEMRYEDAMFTFCQLFPERTDMWEKLILSQIETQDLEDARRYYLKSVKLDVTSEKLEEYKEQIYYSYNIWGESATEFTESTSGNVRLYDFRGYGIMNAKGDMITKERNLYISPLGKESYYLIANGEDEERVLDDMEEVQAIIKPPFEETKAIGNFFIPYLEKGKWYYFSYTDQQKLLGPYDDASTFCDGMAAVKIGDKWVVINREGEEVGASSFSDIVLLGSGEYTGKGIMIASTGKAYGIYDAQGNPKNDFTAQRMDFCFGDWVAYQDGSGKWGFVSLEGEVMIKPEYEEALSFSNGLAAVKKDGTWGFVNHDNKMVIENKFSGAGHFSDEGTVMIGEGDPTTWHVLGLRFKYGR